MKKKPVVRLRNRGKGPAPENGARDSSPKGPQNIFLQSGRSTISVDQPFDYEEVVRATGTQYVDYLHHDGIVFAPYEVLKKHPPVPPSAREECIWMKAGIINFKLCDNDSDCDHCEFDMNMRRAMGEEVRPGRKGAVGGWAARISREFETVPGPCVYASMAKRGGPLNCPGHYECFRCPVYSEQAAGSGYEPLTHPRVTLASGFKVAGDFYYHLGHAWAHMERGGHVRIGMDDFAAKVFGEPRALLLPAEGDSVRQSEVGFVIARNGHRAPVQSPLTGKVVAVNAKVLEDPSACHKDPYFHGWMMLIEPSFLRQELKPLYYGEESLAWMENENRLLLDSLGPEYERLAATGGEPAEDLFGSLPGADWDGLVQKILRTKVKRGAWDNHEG
jgi:glycine cleavage system H lipoate-binding protein